MQNIMGLYVTQGSDQQSGLLGGTPGLVFANQAGSTVGLQTILQIGAQGAAFPMLGSGYGRMIAVEPSFNRSTYPTTAGMAFDLAFMTYHSCYERQPYRVSCTLIANVLARAVRATAAHLRPHVYGQGNFRRCAA
jgi:hypothetical protein